MSLRDFAWCFTCEIFAVKKLVQQHMDDMKAHMTLMKQLKASTSEDQWIEVKRQMELMMQHMDMMLTTMDNMYHQPPEQKSKKHDHRKFKQHN